MHLAFYHLLHRVHSITVWVSPSCFFPIKKLPFASFSVLLISHSSTPTPLPTPSSLWLITPHWGTLRHSPPEHCVRICSFTGVYAKTSVNNKLSIFPLIGSKVSPHWALCGPTSSTSFDMQAITRPLSPTIWQAATPINTVPVLLRLIHIYGTTTRWALSCNLQKVMMSNNVSNVLLQALQACNQLFSRWERMCALCLCVYTLVGVLQKCFVNLNFFIKEML